jgi:DNA repair protein RadC
MTPLASLPLAGKPRQRLARFGASALSLEELLAVLLGTGSAGQDVLSLAHDAAVLLISGQASLADLAGLHGMGEAKAATLLAALSVPDALAARRRPLLLDDPAAVYSACYDLLSSQREELVVFYLDIRSRAIARETVSVGTATASLLHPREIFRPAIVRNASHVVLAHNHPSGDPEPSMADRDATARIFLAGKEVGIELVDHVVCASGGYVSLRQRAPELFGADPRFSLDAS